MTHTTAETVHAGLVRRLAAFALDYVVILAYLILLALVSLGVLRLLGDRLSAGRLSLSPLGYNLLGFIAAILPVMLYFAVLESSPRQATWGKIVLGLKVVRASGGRLSRGKALLRAAIKFLPWQVAHTAVFAIEGLPLNPQDPTPVVMAGLILSQVMVLGYLLIIAVRRDHRAPYDLAAGSAVVQAQV